MADDPRLDAMLRRLLITPNAPDPVKYTLTMTIKDWRALVADMLAIADGKPN